MSQYFRASPVLQRYCEVYDTDETSFRDSFLPALVHYSELICIERSEWTQVPWVPSDVLIIFQELLGLLSDDQPRLTEMWLPMIILRQRHIWPLIPNDVRAKQIGEGQDEAPSAYEQDLRDQLVGQPSLEVQLGLSAPTADSAGTLPSNRTQQPQMFQIRTARDAELNAARWMRFMGYLDAAATPVGPDGGIDVISTHAIAQVKAEASQSGVEAIQRLYGAAAAGHRNKKLLFFVSSGYTRAAVAYADTVGMELYSYDFSGYPSPGNTWAKARLQRLGWETHTGWLSPC